jgi:hypothetical protein
MVLYEPERLDISSPRVLVVIWRTRSTKCIRSSV